MSWGPRPGLNVKLQAYASHIVSTWLTGTRQRFILPGVAGSTICNAIRKFVERWAPLDCDYCVRATEALTAFKNSGEQEEILIFWTNRREIDLAWGETAKQPKRKRTSSLLDMPEDDQFRDVLSSTSALEYFLLGYESRDPHIPRSTGDSL